VCGARRRSELVSVALTSAQIVPRRMPRAYVRNRSAWAARRVDEADERGSREQRASRPPLHYEALGLPSLRFSSGPPSLARHSAFLLLAIPHFIPHSAKEATRTTHDLANAGRRADAGSSTSNRASSACGVGPSFQRDRERLARCATRLLAAADPGSERPAPSTSSRCPGRAEGSGTSPHRVAEE
jgi:hypothetical protein